MKKLFTALLFVSCLHSLAQVTDNSPYSRFALGDLNTFSLAQNTALGGSTVALVDSFQVNILNPASYSFLAKHSPVFDFSVVGRLIRLSTSTSSTKGNQLNPNNIILAMPFTRRWGLAFGLTTYASTGYRIIDNYESPALGGTVSGAYVGTGNINRAFLGTSYMFIDHKKQGNRDQLSIGANGSFLYGDEQKVRQLFLPVQTGMHDAEVVNSLYARDFMVDGGFLYRHNTEFSKTDSAGKVVGKRSQQLTVGMSASLGRDTRFIRSTIARSITQGAFPVYTDTAEFVDSEKGTIYIPARYNVGLTYDFKGVVGSSKYYKLSLTAQYTTQDWTRYKENFSSGTSSDTLRRYQSIGFGVQYIPHQLGYSSSKKINFLRLINYRAGFCTNQFYYRVNNTNINGWMATAGLGIPLIHSFSYSMLNLSFEYGSRGTHEHNLVMEKFWGFHLGIAFSPSRIDRWFVKRKYD